MAVCELGKLRGREDGDGDADGGGDCDGDAAAEERPNLRWRRLCECENKRAHEVFHERSRTLAAAASYCFLDSLFILF